MLWKAVQGTTLSQNISQIFSLIFVIYAKKHSRLKQIWTRIEHENIETNILFTTEIKIEKDTY